MEAGEVGIDVTVDLVVGVGSKDGTLVHGTGEIPDNHLYCRGMGLFGVSSKASDLAHGVGDVRSRVG